ncbi:hypothetical protein DUNSADRAFT_525 [Dunaliella salina]|uniref:Uncharacterized protein n=1 Tax=Dunaliella salina TaxID=3046 RepID=A0ABQ7GY79_DUNSA|nr:hypothetical protein DUNSADRAFT_525 [Dunaliella salina]|eukprot:KAF5839551.1 hypothetical protein DUNSADRAFT_525 [Dunaliella salina]
MDMSSKSVSGGMDLGSKSARGGMDVSSKSASGGGIDVCSKPASGGGMDVSRKFSKWWHGCTRTASQRYKNEQPSSSEDSGGAYSTFRETDRGATVQSRLQHRANGQQGAGNSSSSSSRGAGQVSTSQESMAVLSNVLLPSLRKTTRSLCGTDDAPAQLSQSVATQLAQLERLLPGTSAQLLQQLIVKLVASTDPALANPRSVASTLLGGNNSSSDGSSQLLPARNVGRLGPLGEFLLGQWQEEVVTEQALLARGNRV